MTALRKFLCRIVEKRLTFVSKSRTILNGQRFKAAFRGVAVKIVFFRREVD